MKTLQFPSGCPAFEGSMLIQHGGYQLHAWFDAAGTFYLLDESTPCLIAGTLREVLDVFHGLRTDA